MVVTSTSNKNLLYRVVWRKPEGTREVLRDQNIDPEVYKAELARFAEILPPKWNITTAKGGQVPYGFNSGVQKGIELHFEGPSQVKGAYGSELRAEGFHLWFMQADYKFPGENPKYQYGGAFFLGENTNMKVYFRDWTLGGADNLEKMGK